MSYINNKSDFYIISSKKYKERSALLTLFTKEHGKLNAITRLSKNNKVLLQPFNLLCGSLSINKNNGLNKIYDIELVLSHNYRDYLILVSMQYINELIYILLNFSHEEEKLYEKYSFIVKNIDSYNYKYLLKIFELQLFETLGFGFDIRMDITGCPIDENSVYNFLPSQGFKKSDSLDRFAISGCTILKIYDNPLSWSSDNLKHISRITKSNISFHLGSRELKTRKLLNK